MMVFGVRGDSKSICNMRMGIQPFLLSPVICRCHEKVSEFDETFSSQINACHLLKSLVRVCE